VSGLHSSLLCVGYEAGKPVFGELNRQNQLVAKVCIVVFYYVNNLRKFSDRKSWKMKKSRPTSLPIPHTHAAGMERRHAASTLQPWLDHATPRVCRRRRARRCHGQNSVPSARKRCCQRVSMPSGRGDARSRRSAASMVVTVLRSMAPVRQATPKRALRQPSGRHCRCERHPPQTAMISKTPLVVDLPFRILVELGAVGRCALAESCRTAARSNGDIGQSENRFFAIFFSNAPLLSSF